MWLGLMVLTVRDDLGAVEGRVQPRRSRWSGTFVIAAVKVRYVMLDFMELRHAPSRCVSPSRPGRSWWLR